MKLIWIGLIWLIVAVIAFGLFALINQKNVGEVGVSLLVPPLVVFSIGAYDHLEKKSSKRVNEYGIEMRDM